MSTITFYHNPRCSKSRQSLALLENNGANLNVIRYLDSPPTLAELKTLAAKLKLRPHAFMRTKDALYKELELDRDDVSDSERLKAIAKHPKLLERPIALTSKRAVIGRPPEDILKILK